VQFGLQFDVERGPDEAADAGEAPAPSATAPAPVAVAPPAEPKGEKVVSLDSFRKK
jgi:hypothetical protein